MAIKLFFLLIIVAGVNLLLFQMIGMQLFEALTILFYKGAPYVTTSGEKLKTMLKLAALKKSDRVVDLGSGDGRLLFAAAKVVKEVKGFEINPFVYQKSLKNWKKYHSEEKNIEIEKKNFMKENLSKYDVVFVFGIDYLMQDLEVKLLEELKPVTRVVSNLYQFPNWKVEKNEGEVYLYIKPAE